MKINLIYMDTKPLEGYLNISPFAWEETTHLKIGDLKNLDRFCEDAEAEEIIATHVLDYCTTPEIIKTLDNWIKKIKHGGKLIIVGIDMYMVCKAFYLYDMDIEIANMLLHGPQTMPHMIKKTNLTAIGISKYLENKGLKVIKKRYNNTYEYTVEAERP